MMKIFLPTKLRSLLLGLAFFPAMALAAEWNLPVTVSDANARVGFEVDSTWQLIQGKTKGIRGSIALSDPTDPQSIQAKLEIPVGNFDTGNTRRDRELLEVMSAEQFPLVELTSSKLQGCLPAELLVRQQCRATLIGTIKIRDLTKPVELPLEISLQGTTAQAEGNFNLNWPDFGVSDPSILVAKLDKTVTVHYEILIPFSKD